MTSHVNFGNAILAPSSATATNCAGSASCATLAVPVPAQDVAAPGMITVSVANSSLVSNPVLFAVMPQSSGVTGPPQLLVFSPLIAPAGGASFPLVIEAQNVAEGATVNFGSLSISPTTTTVTLYPSAGALSSLMVQVPATAIAAAGEVAVSVTNPGTSGGTSNQGNFFVLSKSSFPIEESVSNATPPVPGDAASTHSSAAIDGFLVAFDSTAGNLVSGAVSAHSQFICGRIVLLSGPIARRKLHCYRPPGMVLPARAASMEVTSRSSRPMAALWYSSLTTPISRPALPSLSSKSTCAIPARVS